MKPGRVLSLLTGIALVGAVARFNATATLNAQAAENESGEAFPQRIAEPPGPAGNPLWTMPLKQLSVTRERPIFSPSRLPPPPATPTLVTPAAVRQPVKPREPERPALSLVGTIIGASDQIAVFLETQTQSVVCLRVGEDYQSWVLDSVKAREAALVKDGEQALVFEIPPPGEPPAPGRPTVSPLVPRGQPGVATGIIPIVSSENSADEQPVRSPRNARREGR
jgi:general secretion pathway protein N